MCNFPIYFLWVGEVGSLKAAKFKHKHSRDWIWIGHVYFGLNARNVVRRGKRANGKRPTYSEQLLADCNAWKQMIDILPPYADCVRRIQVFNVRPPHKRLTMLFVCPAISDGHTKTITMPPDRRYGHSPVFRTEAAIEDYAQANRKCIPTCG